MKDWTTTRMDLRDQSILTQVAGKIAADVVMAAGATDVVSYESAFPAYMDITVRALLDGVATCEEVNPAPAPQVRSTPTPDSVAAAFGGTATTSSWAIRVAGKQHGDLPDWLFTDAEAKGTTAVFDNRSDLAENPRRPWFVDADNKANAYWPPKK